MLASDARHACVYRLTEPQRGTLAMLLPGLNAIQPAVLICKDTGDAS